MKKLNLLNSLIFALALQSSVSMVAVTEQELVASYNAYKANGSNKQELKAQVDEMISSVEAEFNFDTQDKIYARLKNDLGIDIRQLRNNLQSSLFTKKNVAIAAVGALAVYEIWKAKQAYRNLTGKEYVNEIVNLHLEDGRALAKLAKCGFNKVRSFSPREAARNSFVKMQNGASSLRDASVNVYNKSANGLNSGKVALQNAGNQVKNTALVIAVAAKDKLQDAGSKVSNAFSKLYRKLNPIKPVVDTSYSPMWMTDRQYNVVSKLNVADQFDNLASATSQTAGLTCLNNATDFTSVESSAMSDLCSLFNKAKKSLAGFANRANNFVQNSFEMAQINNPMSINVVQDEVMQKPLIDFANSGYNAFDIDSQYGDMISLSN